jgi:hypothetical protein
MEFIRPNQELPEMDVIGHKPELPEMDVMGAQTTGLKARSSQPHYFHFTLHSLPKKSDFMRNIEIK